jgi:uncharacterized protein YjbI with pentapeptide repeats
MYNQYGGGVIKMTLIVSRVKQRIEYWVWITGENIKGHPFVFCFIIALAAILSIVILHFVQGWKWPDWTGFDDYLGPLTKDQRGKTLWDWLQLFVVPAVLAVGALLFNKSTRESEQKIAGNRQNEASLTGYLDKMTELLLEKNLRTSNEEDEVRSVARARTLTVLYSLDVNRKRQIVEFLIETGLILSDDSIINLKSANLKNIMLDGINFLIDEGIGVDFSGAFLSDASLMHAKLRWARLEGTSLDRADLENADLTEARMNGAIMHKTNLEEAELNGTYCENAFITESNLRNAVLKNAHLNGTSLYKSCLEGADLRWADLGGACFIDAKLTGARLNNANLQGAEVTEKQLSKTASLEGAIMSDGTRHP